MKLAKIAVLLFVSLLPFSPGFDPLEARAGGRSKPETNESRSSLLVTAWYRDKVVHVAIANAGGNARSLKVAIGTRNLREHLFASQSVLLPPQSIKFVYFPLLTRETQTRGQKSSDHVFVADGAASGFLHSAPIQRLDGSLSPSVEDFLAAPGDTVHLRYGIAPGNSLRIFCLPREIPVQDRTLTAVDPAEEGFPRPLDRSALKDVNLPAEYRSKISQAVEGNLCFLAAPRERAEIVLRYAVPAIEKCAVVRLSETRYEFQPNGGVRYGTGPGVAFMIYNPKTMILAPLQELSREEEASSARKTFE